MTATDPTGRTVKIVALNLSRVKNRKTLVSTLNSLFGQFKDLSHPDIAKYLEYYFQNELETFVVIQDYPVVLEQLTSPKIEAEYKLAVYKYLNIIKQTSSQRLQTVLIGSQSVKVGRGNLVKLDNFLAEETTKLIRNAGSDPNITIEDPDVRQRTPAVTVRNILFEAIMNFKVSDSFISFVKLLDSTKSVDSMLSHAFFADLRNESTGKDMRTLKIELPLIYKEDDHNMQGSGVRITNATTENSQPASKITSPTHAMSKLHKGFSSASSSKNTSGVLHSERRRFGDAQEYFGFDQGLSQQGSGGISSTKETPRESGIINLKVHSPLEPSKFSRQASAEQHQLSQSNQQRRLQEPKPLKLLTAIPSPNDSGQLKSQMQVKQTATEPSNRLINKSLSAQSTPVRQNLLKLGLDIQRISNTSQAQSEPATLAEGKESISEAKDSNIQQKTLNSDKTTPQFPMNNSNSSQTAPKQSNQTEQTRGRFLFPQSTRQNNNIQSHNIQLDLPAENDIQRYSIHEIHSTDTIELESGIPSDQKLSILQTQVQPVKKPSALALDSRDENNMTNTEIKDRVTTPTGKSILKTGRSKSNSRVRFAENIIIE